MKSRDFCYWLQGYFELSDSSNEGLSQRRVDAIKNHLNMVFKHEIDPSVGSVEHQKELDAIHEGDMDQVAGASTADPPLPPHIILKIEALKDELDKQIKELKQSARWGEHGGTLMRC